MKDSRLKEYIGWCRIHIEQPNLESQNPLAHYWTVGVNKGKKYIASSFVEKPTLDQIKKMTDKL